MAFKAKSKPPCPDPCKGAFSYSDGIKGRNADITKILFVANRADRRILQQSLFSDSYKETLLKSQTGKIINEILGFCKLTFDDIYFTNLFKCLLLDSRAPSKEEYQNCVSQLEKQVLDFKPKGIVAFGGKVYEFLFPIYVKKINFENIIWYSPEYNRVPTLISNHPCKLGTIISKTKEAHYQVIARFLEKKE